MYDQLMKRKVKSWLRTIPPKSTKLTTPPASAHLIQKKDHNLWYQKVILQITSSFPDILIILVTNAQL